MQKLSENIVSKELMTGASALVFATSNIGIYQNDTRASFILKLPAEEVEFKLCALLSFRKKIQSIDLAEMFMPTHPGIEIISMPQIERFFVFELREILELRDLFAGAM
ncbi:MAG: hypothetical protein NXI00_24645, partial [Cytophagales bacterium]|nr:hypothetical protein [Cytophagales bacterium]